VDIEDGRPSTPASDQQADGARWPAGAPTRLRAAAPADRPAPFYLARVELRLGVHHARCRSQRLRASGRDVHQLQALLAVVAPHQHAVAVLHSGSEARHQGGGAHQRRIGMRLDCSAVARSPAMASSIGGAGTIQVIEGNLID
jgi:hypothetical protein